MTNLNNDQLDVLKEIFNIGADRAAAAFSELADGVQVELSVPSVSLRTRRPVRTEVTAHG